MTNDDFECRSSATALNQGQLHRGYQTVESVLPNFAHCIDHLTEHKSPDETFCSQSMPSVRAGGALGRPCWASSAQLPYKGVSEHFAQGIISSPDITGLAEDVCLACMPGFRAGSRPGRAGTPEGLGGPPMSHNLLFSFREHSWELFSQWSELLVAATFPFRPRALHVCKQSQKVCVCARAHSKNTQVPVLCMCASIFRKPTVYSAQVSPKDPKPQPYIHSTTACSPSLPKGELAAPAPHC
eukprot:2040-Pelagomonas_calceolata.AAC.1